MKVITQRILYTLPVIRRHTYPLHHFCSSSDADPPSNIPQPQSESQSQTSFSSHFSEVKAILQKEPPPHNRSHSLQKFFSSPPQTLPPPKLASLENIRRKISEFRRPSVSSPSSSGSGQYISLQELYKRNVIAKADVPATSSNAPAVKPPSFDALRENILHLQVNTLPAKNESDSSVKNGAVSLARFNESLKLKPDRYQESPLIIGGSESLPSFVEKEKSGNESGKVGSTAAMRTEFLKMYDYSELGSKLKMLRPEKKGRWFSLQELNERLAKLRVIEEKESPVRMEGISFKDLRETLVNLSLSEDDNRNRKRMQRLNVLSQLGGTPSYMLSPPKDHLVEKYFHPDNMSAAEKLKLELRKVRDEFKMSESDCGSARVQVAQLTTKIKYLSTVLQKKDKHSRKGLQVMVQRRKKLLKYLRRTDWDSYCLVLSKLGLRDIPDIKA